MLGEIGADAPQVLVYNKIDLLGIEPRVEHCPEERVMRVWLSAASGAGAGQLRDLLRRELHGEAVRGWLDLPPGRARARLFAMGAVLQEKIDDDGASHLQVQMSRGQFEMFARRERLPAPVLRN
ncbi:MAG: hypothetical protein H0W93_10150 [Gammaproteobacteria bacterium]|nr:hypothetical protein [Gammaproteobacteria bacterium]